MVSSLYYLLRSRLDGSYLAAQVNPATPDPDKPPPAGYLLVFAADYDALSYLNTHAPEVADKFSVETITASQLQPVLVRWNFQGVGIVSEPRQPQVEFFKRANPMG